MTNAGAGAAEQRLALLWRDRGAGPRKALNVDRIVRTAIEVADAEGLDGLAMRKVAERLGFTTMSLYRHVPGRDRLVELMLDEAYGEARPPLTEGGWRERLEAHARGGWELIRRHPWMAEARGGRHLPGPNTIAVYENLLSTLTGTGLRPAQVIAAAGLVGRFVEAEAQTLVEAVRRERRSGVTEHDWWGAQDGLYERLDRYPTLTALWEAGGFDEPTDAFAFGLARVLDGIAALIAAERDETRDGTCPMCGRAVGRTTSGRRRVYCSSACRQRAYRERGAR